LRIGQIAVTAFCIIFGLSIWFCAKCSWNTPLVVLIIGATVLLVGLVIWAWGFPYKQFGPRLWSIAMGLSILGMTAILALWANRGSISLLKADNAWILLVVFGIGVFLCVVDPEKIRMFKLGSVEFERQQEIKEVKDRVAEILQTEANLHKAQRHYACAVWDYARAANKYAEIPKWNDVKQMCGMIEKMTKIDTTKDQFKYAVAFGEEKCEIYNLLSPFNRGEFIPSKLEQQGLELVNKLNEQMKNDYSNDESKKKLKEAMNHLRDIRWKDTFGALGYFAQADSDRFLKAAINCIDNVLKNSS
jgi:hypothetical protein